MYEKRDQAENGFSCIKTEVQNSKIYPKQHDLGNL